MSYGPSRLSPTRHPQGPFTAIASELTAQAPPRSSAAAAAPNQRPPLNAHPAVVQEEARRKAAGEKHITRAQKKSLADVADDKDPAKPPRPKIPKPAPAAAPTASLAPATAPAGSPVRPPAPITLTRAQVEAAVAAAPPITDMPTLFKAFEAILAKACEGHGGTYACGA
jgi:hypothetical protein